MKKITFIICSLFLLSTISSTSWALPPCVADAEVWDDCFGTYEWTSGENRGDKYVGGWKNNAQHGQGTYYYLADNQFKGDKYIGEYKDGKKYKGTYYFLADNKFKGDKFVGEYKNNKKHGKGTYTWADGEKYVGEYMFGKRNGQGKYFWVDGRIDVGEFKNGKLNGYAIRYSADGSIFQEGIFKDDVFQYAQKKPSNSSNSNSKLNKYKEFCEDIGFRIGTEKFAECVLKAMEKD